MNFKKILLFLLGFFVCQNIFWFYKGHSATYLYVETLIAALLFIMHPNSMGLKIQDAFNVIVPQFRLYILITIFCIIPSLLIFYGTRYSFTPIKGLASFLISFLLFFTIIIYRQERECIIKGLYLGFFINIFYSILCFFLYKLGIEWRLIQYFMIEGQEGFALYNTLFYRAQGLFMECSYCMAFWATSLPICLNRIHNIYVKFLIITIVILLAGISFSGNIFFIVLATVLYFYFIERYKIDFTQLFFFVLIIGFILLVFVNSITDYLENEGFFKSLVASFQDLDVNDDNNSSNVIRSEGILNSLKLVVENPLGVGYGCSAPLMDLNFNSLVTAYQATYSFFTKVALESGWIGFILYLVSVVKLSTTLLTSRNFNRKVLGVSVLIVTAVQAANGIGWFSFCLMVIALANIEWYEERYGIKDTNNS